MISFIIITSAMLAAKYPDVAEDLRAFQQG